MSSEKFDKNRKALALFALLALVILVAALSFSDRTNKPMNINGDMLGQDTSETLSDYVSRADDTLASTSPEEDVFALVTFSEALGAADAAEVVEGIERVNALVMRSAAPMGLPEPVDGETREDVFNRQLKQVQRSLDGIGGIQAPDTINGVIVRDSGKQLRTLAEDPEVLVIETLPADAGWGHFGVRPVTVDGSGLDLRNNQ